MQQQENVQVKF